MGKNNRVRGLLIVTTVLVVIVGGIVGVRVWFDANQTQKSAEAFAAMRVIDRRIDLPSVIPSAKRTEAGVEARPLGAGPGPTINYAFKASATPDWRALVDRAIGQAGFGTKGPPWITQVRGRPIGVSITEPSAKTNGMAYVVISTR